MTIVMTGGSMFAFADDNDNEFLRLHLRVIVSMLPFCSILRFLQWSSTQLRITSLSLDEQHGHHQTDRSCARWVS
uniref:Uncharacterized protein n=1 Tax=Triticum urartu TaxID=4572 RepID=A0A8R7V6E6_TRIUA